jgi:diaminopimelate epimerase
MNDLPFVKMQGAGNDFVVLDGFRRLVRLTKTETRRLADRHFGVGADQILILEKSRRADFRMRILNADGSEAEMCGNGIRCAALYAFDSKRVKKKEMTVETRAGVLRPVLLGENPEGFQVRVDMGEPVFETAKIPTRSGQSRVIDAEFQWKAGDGKPETSKITCVSMGNPHCVIFVDDLASAPVEAWGSAIETDPFFPKRTNVEFVQVQSPDRGRVRVWERGVGLTLACGTGACAVGVAGVLTGRFRRKTELTLPGGTLTIEWAPDNHVFMTGPAAFVCEGKFSC